MADPRWCAFSDADRRALLRKYQQLIVWRRARDQAPEAPVDRAALRRLAREFPGALRELDRLGHAELERRIGELERAPAGPPATRRNPNDHDTELGPNEHAGPGVQDWMRWIAAYHRWMRAALAAKAGLAGRRTLTPEATLQVRHLADAAAGAQVDETFVADVAMPPDGQLSRLVLDRCARTFAVSVARLSGVLFPRRHRPPGPPGGAGATD